MAKFSLCAGSPFVVPDLSSAPCAVGLPFACMYSAAKAHDDATHSKYNNIYFQDLYKTLGNCQLEKVHYHYSLHKTFGLGGTCASPRMKRVHVI